MNQPIDIAFGCDAPALAQGLYEPSQQLNPPAKTAWGGIFQCLRSKTDGDRFIYIGDGCRNLCDLAPEASELNHCNIWQLAYSEDVASLMRSLHQSASQLDLWHWQGRLLSASGQLKWVEGFAQPTHLPNGDLLWSGMLLDLSLQKQVECSAFHSPKLFCIAGADGYFKALNPAWKEVFGYSQAELMAKPCLNFVHPDDRAVALTSAGQGTKEPTIHRFKNRYRCNDGTYKWLQWLAIDSSPEGFVYGVAYDVPEHKVSNRSQLESNQQITRILESVTNAFFVLDRQWRFTYINAEAERLIRQSREALLGQSVWHKFPEAIASTFYHEYHRAFDEQTPVHFEALYAPLNRWFSVHAYPSAEGLAVYFDDITDKKKAQLALEKQLERERLISAIAQRIRQSLQLDDILSTTVAEVRSLLESDRVVLFRFHADWSGTVLVESVSQSWMSILNLDFRDPCFAHTYIEKYQQGGISMIEDLSTATLSPCYATMLAQLQVRANLVVPILQGQQLWGLLIAHHCTAPREWHATDIALLKQLATQVGIAIQQSELYRQVRQLNTTLERQVEDRTRQLQQALAFEATLKRITDKVRDSLDEKQILQSAVEELAKQLNVLSCDTGLYDLKQGVSVVSYEYASSADLATRGKIWQMEDYPYIYAQLMAGNSFQFCDAHILRGWVTLLACPLVDDRGVLGDLVLCRSVNEEFSETEIRLIKQVSNQCAIALRQAFLYREAQKQVEELEHLNRLKDDFLSTVSHELRTPLSNIRMTLQTLEITLTHMGLWEPCEFSIPPNLKELDDKFSTRQLWRYVQILKDESQREINLVNDLLDVCRLDSGVDPLMLTNITLQEWIPHLTEAFLSRIDAQHQFLCLELAPQLPPILTDREYLERVIAELLNNACKYTPQGGEIRITAQEQPVGLELRITNTGVDIPPEECDRIFDRFYRIPNNDPWKYGGTGIGLALVKKLVEVLGATIRVESHNQLTQFIIQFSRLNAEISLTDGRQHLGPLIGKQGDGDSGG